MHQASFSNADRRAWGPKRTRVREILDRPSSPHVSPAWRVISSLSHPTRCSTSLIQRKRCFGACHGTCAARDASRSRCKRLAAANGGFERAARPLLGALMLDSLLAWQLVNQRNTERRIGKQERAKIHSEAFASVGTRTSASDLAQRARSFLSLHPTSMTGWRPLRSDRRSSGSERSIRSERGNWKLEGRQCNEGSEVQAEQRVWRRNGDLRCARRSRISRRADEARSIQDVGMYAPR